MGVNGHAKRHKRKADLYALVEALHDRGLHDVILLAQIVHRTPQRIRQVLGDLKRRRPQHDLRDTLDGLPEPLKRALAAFTGEGG